MIQKVGVKGFLLIVRSLRSGNVIGLPWRYERVFRVITNDILSCTTHGLSTLSRVASEKFVQKPSAGYFWSCNLTFSEVHWLLLCWTWLKAKTSNWCFKGCRAIWKFSLKFIVTFMQVFCLNITTILLFTQRKFPVDFASHTSLATISHHHWCGWVIP